MKPTWKPECDPDIVASIERDMEPFDAYCQEQIELALSTRDWHVANNALRWIFLCEQSRSGR